MGRRLTFNQWRTLCCLRNDGIEQTATAYQIGKDVHGKSTASAASWASAHLRGLERRGFVRKGKNGLWRITKAGDEESRLYGDVDE